MYYLKLKDGVKVFYLFENHEYTVGRKNCNILISDDTSISRKHASISVKNQHIKITDLGAKYKTFVNKVELQPNAPVEIRVNDEVKFGILHNSYIVTEDKLNITCSGLTLEEKRELSSLMKKIGGNILHNWSKDCSYLIIREIVLTLKMLCALIEGQPIVTINFWKDYVKNVSKNLPPPNHNNYKPVYSETILNKNINFQYMPARKCLFNNKVFVFKSKVSKAKIDSVIELAGGNCIRFNENEITKEKLSSTNPQYILVEDDLDLNNENDSFTKMINYVHSIQKRPIPFQEIAMAIVLASCEKYCNPDFDRAGTLVKHQEQILFTQDIIAPNTATQNYEMEEKSSFIIPETVDGVIFNDPQDIEEKCSIPVTEKSVPSSSAKRTAAELKTSAKRMKLNEKSQEPEKASDVILNDDNVNSCTSEANYGNSEEMEVKSEEIDQILNDSEELNEFIAQRNNRSSKSAPESKQKDVEIVTSTQIDNFGETTNKDEDQKQCTKNPFGFIRREPKEHKSKTTAKVSDFFKVIPRSNQNIDNIQNISAIEEIPLTSGRKRSSENGSPNESAKKPHLLLNPFALTNASRSKRSGNENPFSKCTKAAAKTNTTQSVNPFADLRSTASKSKQKAERTSKQNPSTAEKTPYTFNITVIDLDMERNYQWLSKNSIVKDEVDSKDNSNMDDQMQKFVESFNNCVIIETKQLIIERTLQDTTNDATIGNKKNFKKFHKVQPLRIQTAIIPRANYVDVICNDTQAINNTFYDSDG